MPLIEWSDNLQMHIRAIDNDHKMLVDIINGLAHDMEAGSPAEHITDHLNALADYAEQHFRREEGFMEEAGYPSIGDHMKQHQVFTQKIHALVHLNETHPERVEAPALLTYLKEWLTNHILKSDMHYAPYLRGAKEGSVRAVQDMRAVSVRVPPDKVGLILQCAMAISDDPEKAAKIQEIVNTKTP